MVRKGVLMEITIVDFLAGAVGFALREIWEYIGIYTGWCKNGKNN
jgi:hypothetical protein